MGCNCGKNRRQNVSTSAPVTPTAPPPPPPAKGQTQSFALLAADGRTSVYGSRLEAEAARARRGGSISLG
jgi:hypothetical protein